jgi:F-type H+-transporting ATPase subunit epsilon
MAKTFTCRVITPEGVLLEHTAVSVQFPAYDGLVGILANHAPMITMVGKGGLTLLDDQDRAFFIDMTGGFAEVRENVLTVLADQATPAIERPAEARARLLEEAREELGQARKKAAAAESPVPPPSESA